GLTDLTTGQAYSLQAEIARLREARGERLIGYKIGCTSREIQQQLGMREPIYGRMVETGYLRSCARISHARFANRAIEGELAVGLASDLSMPSSDETIQRAIGSVFPVIELHDYVIRDPRSCRQELIASSGMHAGFVAREPPHGGSPVRVE